VHVLNIHLVVLFHAWETAIDFKGFMHNHVV